jgi:PTH1 family peptidyl-tRNA hydrolase
VWAVVGLGNPGDAYSSTRHNAGFLFVSHLARSWDVKLKGRRLLAKTGDVSRGGEKVLLAVPRTFMNRSGLSVRAILKAHELETDHLLVVYDDLDIPLGEIRIRKQGSAGTHKGMKSIVQEIGTTRFPRIRLGIGPLPAGADAADYVLAPFKKNEKACFEESLAAAQAALEMILSGEIERAMSLHNRRMAAI